MRILVCGSRTFEDDQVVEAILEGYQFDCDVRGEPLTIIEGGARGADKLAAEWCKVNSDLVGHEQYPADWDEHGRSAGPIRNQRMLVEGKPGLVVAFVDKPLHESRGTNDMVTRASFWGVKTVVIHVEDNK